MVLRILFLRMHYIRCAMCQKQKRKEESKSIVAVVAHRLPYKKKFKYLQKEKRIHTEKIRFFFVACVLNSRSHDLCARNDCTRYAKKGKQERGESMK